MPDRGRAGLVQAGGVVDHLEIDRRAPRVVQPKTRREAEAREAAAEANDLAVGRADVGAAIGLAPPGADAQTGLAVDEARYEQLRGDPEIATVGKCCGGDAVGGEAPDVQVGVPLAFSLGVIEDDAILVEVRRGQDRSWEVSRLCPGRATLPRRGWRLRAVSTTQEPALQEMLARTTGRGPRGRVVSRAQEAPCVV